MTCALHVTSSPTSTGFLKLSSSTRAVTTFVWACFCAATPAALSIIFIISPPCTFPAGLACIGNTSCASIECECFIVCDSIMPPPYCTFLIIFSIFKHLLCMTQCQFRNLAAVDYSREFKFSAFFVKLF